MLAAWRKRDLKSNEAGVKYYLMGVFASAVMLYGMSLLYGVTRHARCSPTSASVAERRPATDADRHARHRVHPRRLRLQGVGRAVPHVGARHLRGRAHPGHRLPVGGVEGGRLRGPARSCVFVGFSGRNDVWQPLFWVLAALTMTVGNLIALRQTNIVRMLAYSSIAQAGFMLAPLAVVGRQRRRRARRSRPIVIYLLDLRGDEPRRLRRGASPWPARPARREIASFGGLFEYAPGL